MATVNDPREDPRLARLLEAIQSGLPLTPRPYAELGERVGLSEGEVVDTVSRWVREGLIKRLGVVVRHRPLGYRANAMVVWDVPDDRVGDIGRRMSAHEFVTLCYRRPRRGEDWPYNLFCMIHGRDRHSVNAQIELLAEACGLTDTPRAVLFSSRCFKQRGARYLAEVPSGDTRSGRMRPA
ncbi:siroheme decarboxylase subunit beta [Methylotetracoccus oryzae]|uniref:siroheme decarboxylase subunit beta n=1 Tax=Methylotetracoccus oryzae TaxID=1919059 RepID=UPI001F29D720|nr:AsnC family protein [Methylotetracoccus oryzae]